MVKGLIIPAEASASIEVRGFERLEGYQAVVGGWIEPVDIPDLGITVYVNEEGLLRHLPPNSRATFLWWYHVPESRQRAMLVGDAVIVGWPDQNGDSTDLPEEVIELLRPEAGFAIEARPSSDDEWGRDERSYEYVDATVWAMLLIERSEGRLEVRIVPTN